MNSITVKFGTYNVVENKSNNGVTLYNGSRKVFDIANVQWWDRDNIMRLMYINEAKIRENDKDSKDEIIENLQKRIGILEHEQNKLSININNVSEVLEMSNKVLKDNIKDPKTRGFICSRLSQITNRLNETNV